METAVKDLVKTTLYTLRFYHVYRALKTPKKPCLLVLMYHDILPETRTQDSTEIDNQSPSERHFEAHLREIVRHYPLVSLRESVETLRLGKLKEHSVAITFDDGYESLYSAAYPLLKKYNAPATVFLLTDWIDHRRPFWWHRIRDMVKGSAFVGITRAQLERALEIPCEGFEEGRLDTRTRRFLARSIEHQLRDIRDDDREARLQDLERLLFPEGNYVPRMEKPLRWDQIREMAAHRIEFEAHTCSHINIRYANVDTVEREIVSSKLAIEKHVGREVRGFAYPYGKDVASYAAVEHLLRKHGFRYACTAQRGLNYTDTSPYLLKRHALPSTVSSALLHRNLILQFARSDAEDTRIPAP